MPPAPVSVTSRASPRSSAASSASSALAAHERRLRRRQVPPRPQLGRLDRKRRILLEDRLLQLLQGGARLEAELVPHRLAHPPKHLERRGLPIAPIEGEHQLPAEPLAARVLRDQRLELGNEIAMAAELQVGLDPILERRQPQLLQPRHLRLRERLVPHVLVGRPAPQPERLAKGSTPPRRPPRPPAPTDRAPPAARTARDPARRAPGTVDTRAPPARFAPRPAAGATRARAPGGRSPPPPVAAHPIARRSAGRATRPRPWRSAGTPEARPVYPTPARPQPTRRRPARGPVRGNPCMHILRSRKPLRKSSSPNSAG